MILFAQKDSAFVQEGPVFSNVCESTPQGGLDQPIREDIEAPIGAYGQPDAATVAQRRPGKWDGYVTRFCLLGLL
jgi:hypothetical protein